MVGTTVSHYRVVRRLGEGGMGVVYEAEDLRLGRPVALKFLPDHLACDRSALERFQAEARAASSLNHPHICTIYDVDEAEGRPFIAMELLEGEPLRARLARPLPVAAIVHIALQLAEALEAAHAKGIVHRDIKPENVFVSADETAKLLDFGIAKLVTEQTAAGATTRVGTGPLALGTVAYMSPEQARGEALDARTDLFSLGVVLYEMATGAEPFRGATTGAILGEILTGAPIPPVRLNPEVPPELERIVNKLLEKERELRYQSARDVRVDLERLRRRLAAPAAAPRPPAEQASIVVLPFENLSPDPDNAFFADGLTEEIIADLSKVRALRVISRTSAMLLKGSKKDVPTIARELNVRYVLEGSVRRAGSHMRITAQLIDAPVDAHLWAEKYSGTLDDVFDLQENLSRQVVEALKLELTGDERRRLAGRAIPNVEALDCYFLGRQEMYRMTEAGLGRASALVDRALGLVGPNALLYAMQGEIQFLFHDQGIHVDEATLARAGSCAEQALAIAPDCGAAYRLKGYLANRRGDVAGAIKALRTGFGLERSGESAFFVAFVEAEAGRIAEAEADSALSVDLDPLLWLSHWTHALAALLAGHFDLALARMERGTAVAGEEPFARFFTGIANLYSGRRDAALSAFGKAAGCAPGPAKLSVLFSAMLRGDAKGAVSELRDASFRNYARQDKEMSWWLAGFCAQAAEQEEALFWLQNAIDLGFTNHHFLSALDPLLAPLRGTPRFEALMDRAREAALALDAALSRSLPAGGGYATR